MQHIKKNWQYNTLQCIIICFNTLYYLQHNTLYSNKTWFTWSLQESFPLKGAKPKEAKDLVNWRIRPGTFSRINLSLMLFTASDSGIFVFHRDTSSQQTWYSKFILHFFGGPSAIRQPWLRKSESRQAWTPAEDVSVGHQEGSFCILTLAELQCSFSAPV